MSWYLDGIFRQYLFWEAKSKKKYIWKVFRFIIFGDRSAYLAYHVYKSGRKTSIIIIFIIVSVVGTLIYF